MSELTYIKISVTDLEKLEQARKDLYSMFPDADTAMLCNLHNITQPMWKVANTRTEPVDKPVNNTFTKNDDGQFFCNDMPIPHSVVIRRLNALSKPVSDDALLDLKDRVRLAKQQERLSLVMTLPEVERLIRANSKPTEAEVKDLYFDLGMTEIALQHHKTLLKSCEKALEDSRKTEAEVKQRCIDAVNNEDVISNPRARGNAIEAIKEA